MSSKLQYIEIAVGVRTLNVAGPRESKSPGVQAKTKAFLSGGLWEV